MHSRTIELRHGPRLLVRPLRRGDADTVVALFARLGEQSRRRRFHGSKPRLDERELRVLTAVDARHHALVAHVDGDSRPAGIARLVRDGNSAEIAIAVADEHQHRGIGSALTCELIADARAAGVTEITALVSSDNPAAVAVLRRVVGALEIRFEGTALSIRGSVRGPRCCTVREVA
jgi:ribosomal protein S18 acetylase RimI-like enzyme